MKKMMDEKKLTPSESDVKLKELFHEVWLDTSLKIKNFVSFYRREISRDDREYYEPLKFISLEENQSPCQGHYKCQKTFIEDAHSYEIYDILPKGKPQHETSKPNDKTFKTCFIAYDRFGKSTVLKHISYLYKNKIRSFLGKNFEAHLAKYLSARDTHFPILIDLCQLWPMEGGTLIEKIATHLHFKESILNKEDIKIPLIFIFDHFDKLSTGNQLKMIKELHSFVFPLIIAANKNLDDKVFSQIKSNYNMYEILPLNSLQIVNIVRKVIQDRSPTDRIPKIGDAKSGLIAKIPFSSLPAEFINPYFIILLSKELIKYIDSHPKSSEYTLDELIEFLFQIEIDDKKERLLEGSCFALIKESQRRKEVFVKKLRDIDESQIYENEIENVILGYFKIDLKDFSSFSTAFFFQKLLIKEFVVILSQVLVGNDFKISAEDVLDSYIPLFIREIEEKDPVSFEEMQELQVHLEYLILFTQYIRKPPYNIYDEFYELQKDIFSRSVKHFFSKDSHVVTKQYWLRLIRIAYDPGYSKEKLTKQEVEQLFNHLEAVEISKENSFEENNIYFSALLFFIKHFFAEKSEEIFNLVEKFSRTNPFSGLIIYMYLFYRRENFAKEIEPLLTAVDQEPPGAAVGSLTSKFAIVLRAIEAIGALGSEHDAEILNQHGFINMSFRTGLKINTIGIDYSFVERYSHYALEELFSNQGVSNFDNSSIKGELENFSILLQKKIPFLFDNTYNRISIYAEASRSIYDIIRNKRYSNDMTEDSSKTHYYERYLHQKAGNILSDVSKEYFRHKSFKAFKFNLVISLDLLNQELEKIHNSGIGAAYLIEKYNEEKDKDYKITLDFEVETVDRMREIVRNYTEKQPQDLISLSEISFTRWFKQKKLGSEKLPAFSANIESSNPDTVATHVVKSNREIVERITSIHSPCNADRVFCILDIGGGVGNTTEAIIEYFFPQNSKNIYTVEFHADYVKHYCQRMAVKALERFYFSGFSDDFKKNKIHIIKMDIHEFLQEYISHNNMLRFHPNKISLNARRELINFIHDRAKKASSDYDGAIYEYMLDNVKEKGRVFLKKLNTQIRKESQGLTDAASSHPQKSYSYLRWLKAVEGSLKSYSTLSEDGRDCLKFREDLDLIIANYVLHHLTVEYRENIYVNLLRLAKPNAFLAISDPNEGISIFNRRHFNFLDEGVFACLTNRNGCISEVESVEPIDGYKWVNIPPEDIETCCSKVDGNDKEIREDTEVGYIAIFQKQKVDTLIDPDDLNLFKKHASDFAAANPLKIICSDDKSFAQTIEFIIKQFTHQVLYDAAYELLWDDNFSKPKIERASQLLFKTCAKSFCRANNVDLTREAKLGRGIVDFKFSSGYINKAILEVKLAQNTNFWHGLKKQLPMYLKAEDVQLGYYLVVCYTDDDFKKIKDYEKVVKEVNRAAKVNIKLEVVDARCRKPSASKL